MGSRQVSQRVSAKVCTRTPVRAFADFGNSIEDFSEVFKKFKRSLRLL